MQNKLEIAFSIVVGLFPALAIYIFLPGTSLASFLILVLLISLLFTQKKMQYNYDEFVYLFCIVFISVVSCILHLVFYVEWFDFSLFSHNMYSFLLCLLPLCFVNHYLNTEVFVKTVLFFGTVASIVLMWQWITLFLTGDFPKEMFIPWFEIKRDLESFSKFRPSSFFMEPAHYAIYMLPAFQIALMYKRKILIFTFAVSILCSGSSTGFILLGVLLFYHLYKVGAKKWYIALMMVAVLALSYFIILSLLPEVLLYNIEKIGSVTEGQSSNRLLGPLDYLALLHFHEHIFGITLNQLSNLLLMEGFFNTNGNYANAVIYMYISFGITGLVVLCAYIVRKIRAVKESYGFILIFIGILCSDQILFNGNYFYLLTFVLMSDKIYKNGVLK